MPEEGRPASQAERSGCRGGGGEVLTGPHFPGARHGLSLLGQGHGQSPAPGIQPGPLPGCARCPQGHSGTPELSLQEQIPGKSSESS